MRYIDSGSRDASEALGTWLQHVLDETVMEVRWQSGFFNKNSLTLFESALRRLTAADSMINVLIGSNSADTTWDDIASLVDILGIPRPNARLGIVSYGNAFFHPKTFHIRRADGSQASYVGSANMTASGLGLHVEAGLILDSHDGDAPDILSAIANAIDIWFREPRPGFYLIDLPSRADELLAAGVIAKAFQKQPPHLRPSAAESTGARLDRLKPLLARSDAPGSPNEAYQIAFSVPQEITGTSVPLPDFPPYLLFDSNANEPTAGILALSGSELPGQAAGLIVRLNRDSARHFSRRSGTANISIPVATVGTLRFGFFRRRRPRAEFALRLRYLGEKREITQPPAATNVMAYGFTRGESGHGDIRMVVPAAVLTLAVRIFKAGLPVPREGDPALLEWPSVEVPAFSLTFMERDSQLFRQAQSHLARANETGQLVGDGACWLMLGLSPSW